MTMTDPSATDGAVMVPSGVLQGIDDITDGHTADADALDSALSWMPEVSDP